MKTLLSTAAAIAISATSAFSAAPSDVEHLVDNEYSYSSWANAFFTTYADEFGGQAFTNLPNTITTLEALVVSAQNELENEYTSYQIYLDGGMEADAELSQIQIYALSGKIQGTNKLIATIEGLHDTSALDDANDTIDHLNDQLEYWGNVVADQQAELATIAADTAAEVTASVTAKVTAQFEDAIADAEATVLAATAVSAELKGEKFALTQALANSMDREAILSDKAAEAHEAGAVEANSKVADVIEGFNPKDADKFRADAPGFINDLYNYILSLQSK